MHMLQNHKEAIFMYDTFEITKVLGREILDSRGNPTVEVEVWLEGGAVGRAAVPSGASTGKFEAVELRDGGRRYGGLGVKKAVEHVNTILADSVVFESALNQKRIDSLLREADGTESWGPMPSWVFPWLWPGRLPTAFICPYSGIWEASPQARCQYL